MPILGLDEVESTSIFSLALNASTSLQLVLLSGTFRDRLALKISNKVISDDYEHSHMQYTVAHEKTLSLDSREDFPNGCLGCVEDIPSGRWWELLALGSKLGHPYQGFRETWVVF